jgi:hypothetical protein
MKKIISNKFILAFALLGALSSCNDDDVTYSSTEKVKVSVGQTAYSVGEGDTFTVNLALDKAIKSEVALKIDIASGTGSFRDIFSDTDDDPETDEETTVDDGWGIIGYKVIVPAYATTFSFDIDAVKDMLPEGTETIRLRLSSAGNSNGLVEADSQYIDVTIADYVSNDVALELVWDKHYTNAHGNIVQPSYATVDANGFPDSETYASIDFDFWVEDAGGTVVDGYSGATGNTPEVSEILETQPDGDYYVYVDLYDAGVAPVKRFKHDLKINVAKYGVWYTTVPITTYSDEVFSDYVIKITKTGTTYRVADAYTDTEIISGRNARVKKHAANKRSK